MAGKNPIRRRQMAERYVFSTLTLAEVGQEFGVSRQAVDQAVRREFSKEQVQQERATTKAVLAGVRERQRARQAEPCIICGAPNLRGVGTSLVTCSRWCAKSYQQFSGSLYNARHSDRHRESQARSILRHADKRSPSQVAWAQRFMAALEAGTVLPKARTMPRWSPIWDVVA